MDVNERVGGGDGGLKCCFHLTKCLCFKAEQVKQVVLKCSLDFQLEELIQHVGLKT